MELSLYFTELVLTMCAVDLVWTASARIDTWWNENVRPLNKPGVFAQSRGGLVSKAQAPQRNDWYVFFHCSDLVGREPLHRDNVSVGHDQITQPPVTTSSTNNLRNPSSRPMARLPLS